MKKQLGGLLAGALVASALGAASGWARHAWSPPSAPGAASTAGVPACRSSSCCTLSIAAESLTSASRHAAAPPERCEPRVDVPDSP